nr:reverse transcriptase domain-containing protein [Tanacetum cinerariifolium]
MADNRTMEEMLQAPTEGYGDAIVVPDILVENFKIRTGLLSLIQVNQFHGFESNNPHDHIRSFNRITLTLKFKDVSNDSIKVMLFPYSLEGAAKIWYDKEPPRSILTRGDLEIFGEAWERFKEMLRQYPHRGFLELHQIDTFFNGLNEHEKDSLNSTVGGNLLSRTPRDALTIIENKSKVRYSRNKPFAFKVSTTSSGSSSSMDARIDKLTDTISNLVESFNKKMTTPVMVKAVEETCVVCGGAHPYYDCIATDSNISSACAATESSGIELKVQDDSNRSGKDTNANDADIRPIYDEEPMVEEKVFATTALKNNLMKLKGNNVDTKFAKTSVLGKPVLQSLKNQSVVRQPNAFKSERLQMLKQRYATHVYVNNNLSRPVTQHYLPKRREFDFAKPNHMVASTESRNSSKNMARSRSSNMVHNHYLDEARKKTQK